MTSTAAIDDLANRIASNTLTAAQQAALVEALGIIAPDFPSPDEISNSIDDFTQARTWIASLYAIAAAFGGASVLPTQQIAWYVNAVSGNDANDGASPATPVKTVAQIALRWRGVGGGGKPTLQPATGNTITVTLQTDIPVTDPLSPILDVNINSPGGTPTALIIVGGAKTSGHAGTINTATAFARTTAGGQPVITDVSVANFAPFVGTASLMVDSTTGAVGWLYGPDAGASANGTLSVGYSAQTAGTVPTLVQTAYAGGNAYTLSDVIHASLGSGFTTRSFPEKSTSVTGASAQVFFYRLHLVEANNNDNVQFASPSVAYFFQECQLDHAVQAVQGGGGFLNCFSFHNLGYQIIGTAVFDFFAGALSGQNAGTITASNAGVALVDQDFAVFSATPYIATAGGELFIGNAGFWVQGGGNQAIDAGGGGDVVFTPLNAAGTVFYGTDGGTPIVISGAIGQGQILYHNDGGGTPAADQFKFTHSTFKVGDLTSAFGFNATTGAYVGPTTNTLAHLDAALGAGTGFGGQAIDPSTGSYLRLAA